MAESMITDTAKPVKQGERLFVVDVLRGVALLGMFIAHFFYQANESPNGVNYYVSQLFHWFVDGRFYTLFAILFGVGFAIQFKRATTKGQPFVARYLRRLLILLLLGIVIEVGFGYAVLIQYAICGALLLFIRKLSTRSLLILMLVCVMLQPMFRTTYNTIYASVYGVEQAIQNNELRRANVMATGKEIHQNREIANNTTSFSEAVAARAKIVLLQHSNPVWTTLNLLSGTFLCFIIGLLCVRAEVFESVGRKRRLIIGSMLFGLISWITSMWLLPFYEVTQEYHYPNVSYFMQHVLTFGSEAFSFFRSWWLTFTYMGVVILLSQYPKWVKWLSPFRWTGKMALTNYVLQVVLLSFLYDNYALDFPETEAVLTLAYALFLFGSMVVFSQWWLSRYQFGPMEWLWRSVTYWQVQPLRREQSTGQLLSTEDVAVQPVEVTPLASDNSTPVE